jgi:hypothetical protein
MLWLEGTAIYVFGVMDNNQGSFVAQTKLSISLDGHPVGEFLHVPDGTSGLNGYEYNVVVYANHSIPNGEHRLIVSTIAESKHSVFLFDYAIYTYVIFFTFDSLVSFIEQIWRLRDFSWTHVFRYFNWPNPFTNYGRRIRLV